MTIKPKSRRLRAVRSAADLETLGTPFVPDAPNLQAISRESAPARPAAPAAHQKIALTDSRVDAVIDFAGGRTVFLYDQGGTRSVAGLRLRIGPRSATWSYVSDRVDHGERKTTCETLGRYDRGIPSGDTQIRDLAWHMDTEAARKAAAVIAGRIAGGAYRAAGSRAATKFTDAFAAYLDYLQDKAGDKPARWRHNVRQLGAKHLLPKWGNWSLLEMSQKRKQVAAWYNGLAKESVSSAHHCRRIIRAIYNREAEQDDTLPGDKNPARAKITLKENWTTDREKPAMGREQFPAWLEAWRKLPPMNRAYHLVNLLTGSRPGELSRTVWRDLDARKRTLTIGDAKAGNDIVIPLSAPIARALKMARDAEGSVTDRQGLKGELIFPGSEHWGHRDELPVRGHALRRTYKGIATNEGIPDETSALLLGHVPAGMSAKYAQRQVLLSGKLLRRLQRELSAEMLRLFGADATRERPEPLPPSPREVARTKGLLRYSTGEPCEAGHMADRSTATSRCVECVRLKNVRQLPRRKASRPARRDR